MAALHDPAIPPSSLVLVTGANGFLGSHIADQFMAHGYKVRGTVRDPAAQGWLTEFFDARYGSGVFELVGVPDMAAEGAFDGVVGGVSAFVHTASVLPSSPDPATVIPPTVAGVLNALRAAAAATPPITRFVLTSSSAACHNTLPTAGLTITPETWNDAAVTAARAPPPWPPTHFLATYAASKVLAERALWDWVAAHKPAFAVNAVLPSAMFGRVLDPANQGFRTSSAFPVAIFRGEVERLRGWPPGWCVDPADAALLHVGAVLDREVVGERILGYAQRYNVSGVLGVFRGLFPERRFVGDVEGEAVDESVVLGRERAAEVLGRLGKEGGFESLEAAVGRNVESLL